MTPREIRELEWLRRETALAARLTDEERIAILDDLWNTLELIRRAKSPEELRREEEARRKLEAPGRTRYRELAERFE